MDIWKTCSCIPLYTLQTTGFKSGLFGCHNLGRMKSGVRSSALEDYRQCCSLMTLIKILADKVQTLISFYLLNKMLQCVGIVFLVEFSKYLESFSIMTRHFIAHKQFGLYFLLNHRVDLSSSAFHASVLSITLVYTAIIEL